jgi:DNA-binding transcriptional ArsR family regulator
MKEFKPADLHMIRDLEAAKAIADPLRLQIIEALLNRPLTVNQIAKKLGLAASRLYYHVNTLEKHDLIRVVDTTIHGNLIEKHYRVSAYNFSVDPEIYNFDIQENEGVDNLISMALNHLDIVREDFARSIEARAFNLEHGAEPHPRRVIQSRVVIRISDEQVEDFQSRLQDLLKEFEALDEPENTSYQPWAFTVFLYPTFYYDQPDSEV